LACSVCGRYICAPSCPMYSGEKIGNGETLGVCALCRKTICANEKYVRKPEIIFCKSCYEQASVYSLKRFLKKEDL